MGLKSYRGINGLAEPPVLWKLPLSGHTAHGLPCCRLAPVANDPYATTPTRDVASVDRTWSRRGPIEQLEVTTVFGFTMLRDIAR